jgi:hypothetical protein
LSRGAMDFIQEKEGERRGESRDEKMMMVKIV